MPYLRETPDWETAIYKISTVDPVLGGTDGISNLQATQLANRTQWLKAQSENQGVQLENHANRMDEHESRFEANESALSTQHNQLQAHATAENPHPQYQGHYRATAGGTADSITAVFDIFLPEPPLDQTLVLLRAQAENTSPIPTLTVAGHPPRDIVKAKGVPLKSGDIGGAGYDMILQFNALLDKWVLLNPAWGEKSDIITPVGTMVYWPQMTPPDGWLERNGAEISRTAYASLFEVIGPMYGEGDGWSTFNLPDDRALFERGWDHGLGIDEARGFGSIQGDAIRNITGYFGRVNTFNASPPTGPFALYGGPTLLSRDYWWNHHHILFDASLAVPVAPENRPRNRAYLPIIKYR